MVTRTYSGKSWRPVLVFLGIISLAIPCGPGGAASSADGLSSGATVYLPVYSHIPVGVKGISFDLAISLSIRNTDPNESISIQSVAYHDSNGKLVKNFLNSPVFIGPLASKDYFVSESDTTGGFGAFFLVRWTSAVKVNEPIIEGVMAGTKSGQGISFTSRGQVLMDRPR